MIYLSNHQLMYALVDIIREFQGQGVRRIMFGTMFQRLDRIHTTNRLKNWTRSWEHCRNTTSGSMVQASSTIMSLIWKTGFISENLQSVFLRPDCRRTFISCQELLDRDRMPSYQPNHCWWLCFTLSLHDGGSGLRLNDGFFVKLKPVGWGLLICLWLGPPWFNYRFSFTVSHNRISHEYSSFFYYSD